jgi:hypothetical protein
MGSELSHNYTAVAPADTTELNDAKEGLNDATILKFPEPTTIAHHLANIDLLVKTYQKSILKENRKTLVDYIAKYHQEWKGNNVLKKISASINGHSNLNPVIRSFPDLDYDIENYLEAKKGYDAQLAQEKTRTDYINSQIVLLSQLMTQNPPDYSAIIRYIKVNRKPFWWHDPIFSVLKNMEYL